jgi:hypothetical protein
LEQISSHVLLEQLGTWCPTWVSSRRSFGRPIIYGNFNDKRTVKHAIWGLQILKQAIWGCKCPLPTKNKT